MERIVCILWNQSLADLHRCLLHSFDRTADRPYEFSNPGPTEAENYVPASEMVGPVAELAAGTTEETPVGSVLRRRGDQIAYLFDPDAQWLHVIELLDIDRSFPERDYPRLVALRGKSPEREGRSADAARKPDGDAGGEEYRCVDEAFEAGAGGQPAWERRGPDDAPLSPRTKMATALRNRPFRWLRRICRSYGLGTSLRKDELIAEVVRHFGSEEVLERAWGRLPVESRRLLAHLLVEEDGWAAWDEVLDRFGEEGDGDCPRDDGRVPFTSLGVLRMHGLVFIGARRRKGRSERIVSIPRDLRDPLRELAGRPDAFVEHGSEEAAPDSRIVEITFDDGFIPPDEMDLETFLEEVSPVATNEEFYSRAAERFCSRRSSSDAELQRELLMRTIGLSNATKRHRLYRTGLRLFGKEFVEPALEDDSKTVRDWAHRTLFPAQGELF
ncbi:MAG: IS1096 element passenger TnpR family protein [Candidatus Fermentibacterota bacterium]